MQMSLGGVHLQLSTSGVMRGRQMNGMRYSKSGTLSCQLRSSDAFLRCDLWKIFIEANFLMLYNSVSLPYIIFCH